MAIDAKSYKRGVYDSLYEPGKDYDGAFLPFDLPHNDLAVNSYKSGRAEGDELKKEIAAKGLDEGTRRGIADSVIDPDNRDYNGKYKPFDLPGSAKKEYKNARVEGDKLRKDIEGRTDY
ncbi:MAG: hypothetical protein PHF87_01980 [Desulfotomaculaceae bacterium]|nr:hypothetical protein [Desulfotomaculaceae bacterium]